MSNASETLSSLRFATRAKGITNSVQSNACSIAGQDVANLLMEARRECDDLRNEVQQLKQLQADLMASNSGADAAEMAEAAARPITAVKTDCMEAAQTRLVLFCFALGMVQLLCSAWYIWWRRTTCV